MKVAYSTDFSKTVCGCKGVLVVPRLTVWILHYPMNVDSLEQTDSDHTGRSEVEHYEIVR